MATNPITGICIVDKKSSCPPRYTLLEKTAEGDDADLWKDGLFRSKITRYICYTRMDLISKWNHVITNLVLLSIKDPTPQGYTAIRETFDTKEQPLRKHILCYQMLPRTATPSGISEIQLTKTDHYKMDQLTNVGEVNGLNLVYKLTALPKRAVAPSRAAPPPPPTVQTVTPLAAPPPAPRRPRGESSANSTHNAISGIEFKLNERFSRQKGGNNQDDLNIVVKSQSELDDLFSYDFSMERKLVVR